jgi:hypothetical protein
MPRSTRDARAVCLTDANNHKAYCLSNKHDYIPEPMQFGEFTFIMTHSPNELPLNIMLSWPCSTVTGCIAGGGCKSVGAEAGATWSTLVTACLPDESFCVWYIWRTHRNRCSDLKKCWWFPPRQYSCSVWLPRSCWGSGVIVWDSVGEDYQPSKHHQAKYLGEAKGTRWKYSLQKWTVEQEEGTSFRYTFPSFKEVLTNASCASIGMMPGLILLW